ncbi:hypothetical protein HDU84_003202 [Entophlyctis sp. JEL0112]|nr:hypothetical protein HDU84_003202 [Entophlyctis sp. JEL0112]
MIPTGDVDSSKTLEFTFVEDSLSCWVPFYWAHVIFAYVTVISGLLCMLTRLHTKVIWMHYWLGRVFILAMIWATASSILIHNKGLPTGVLYSFLWVLIGLTVGWIAISLHVKRVFKTASKQGGEKNRVRRVLSEVLSLKAFHGCIMFVCWINVAGRLFVTPITGDFACYTYPVYKQLNSSYYTYTGGPVEPLPSHDPVNYLKTPWANKEQVWAAALLLGPYFGAFLVSTTSGSTI